MTFQPNVLASLPKRLQVLAVAVLNAVIEQVDHLLDVSEVPGEVGLFYTLVSVTSLPESKGRTVMQFDGLYEGFDLEGNV